ncbi:MAG TPA: amidase [Candidatus Acidoferrales bacterium]|nr:amidase [Candidatus Acidoferrales bacterium]
MDDLNFLPASEMAARIRRKEISIVELAEAHLSRIDRVNPRINAIVSLDPERIRREARSAETAVLRGEPLGPLHGVPITIKSSIDVQGLPCQTGSKLRAGNIPEADAPLVRRLKAAGAIVLGNTNVPELLMAYETDNLLDGRTNNPWDLECTPGGSSGGEAAAIAAGCSAGGVGSDGGGSIRVPAHFSGICGLKPTPGRIPATGHFPGSLGPFTQLGVVGPMARTVGDLELLLEAMAGPDDGDVRSAPVPLRRLDMKALPSDLRIGYFEDDGIAPVTLETRQAVRKAAKSLQDQGFTLEPFRPEGLEHIRELWWFFFGLVGGQVLASMIQGHEAELSPILLEFMGFVRASPPLSLSQLLDAWMERDQCKIRFLEQMRKYPVLLSPVCSVPAFRHGERKWEIDGKEVGYLDSMRYTQWFNLLGNPAVVVPVGRSPEGLPIGVQLAGRHYEEEIILAVARCVERGCDGWERPPC